MGTINNNGNPKSLNENNKFERYYSQDEGIIALMTLKY